MSSKGKPEDKGVLDKAVREFLERKVAAMEHELKDLIERRAASTETKSLSRTDPWIRSSQARITYALKRLYAWATAFVILGVVATSIYVGFSQSRLGDLSDEVTRLNDRFGEMDENMRTIEEDMRTIEKDVRVREEHVRVRLEVMRTGGDELLNDAFLDLMVAQESFYHVTTKSEEVFAYLHRESALVKKSLDDLNTDIDELTTAFDKATAAKLSGQLSALERRLDNLEDRLLAVEDWLLFFGPPYDVEIGTQSSERDRSGKGDPDANPG